MALWFGGLYNKLYSNGFITEGPKHFGELHRCPLTIENYFKLPINIVQGQAFHHQLDFDGMTDAERLVYGSANDRWSPLAANPDQEAETKLSVQMNVPESAFSALFLTCRSDRYNSAQFDAKGLRLDLSDYHHFQGNPDERETSSITVDVKTGACFGRNRNVAGACAMLYGQSPSHIELRTKSTWSIVNSYFRYVNLGESGTSNARSSAVVTEENGTQTIVPASDRKLDHWTIPPFNQSPN